MIETQPEQQDTTERHWTNICNNCEDNSVFLELLYLQWTREEIFNNAMFT